MIMPTFGRATGATVLSRLQPPADQPDALVECRDVRVARLALLDQARDELEQNAAEADDRLAEARARLAAVAIAHGGRRLTIGQAPTDLRELDRVTHWRFGSIPGSPTPPA